MLAFSKAFLCLIAGLRVTWHTSASVVKEMEELNLHSAVQSSEVVQLHVHQPKPPFQLN